MSIKKFRQVLPAVLLVSCACTARPRPPSLTQLAEARSAPASQDARRWAPQAHAKALLLEKQANTAFNSDDGEATEILSEGALASHDHAWILAQLAKGEQRRATAQAALDESRKQLSALEAQRQSLQAEALSLEMRVRVATHSSSGEILGSASPARRLARHRAAGALATQARLLCVSARLLGQREAAGEVLLELDALESKLTLGAKAENLQKASKLRAKCLNLLSTVRAASQAPVIGATSGQVFSADHKLPTDALLAEFSSAGWSPSRDERGVVLPLADLFQGNGKLDSTGLKTLKGLAQAAKRQSRYPLLLVGHSSRRGQNAVVDDQLDTVKSALEKAGSGVVMAMNAGLRQPLVPHGSPGSRSRNQRLELVFVSPTW